MSFCAPDEHDYLRDIQKLVGLDFGLPARKGGGNGGRPGGAKPANGAAKPGGNSRNRNRNRRRRGRGDNAGAAKMQSA